ncbi:hypothetical protein AAMO2058_000280300 [Amorphochlora amoebiformis]
MNNRPLRSVLKRMILMMSAVLPRMAQALLKLEHNSYIFSRYERKGRHHTRRISPSSLNLHSIQKLAMAPVVFAKLTLGEPVMRVYARCIGGKNRHKIILRAIYTFHGSGG